jgi:hypothetical protein
MKGARMHDCVDSGHGHLDDVGVAKIAHADFHTVGSTCWSCVEGPDANACADQLWNEKLS